MSSSEPSRRKMRVISPADVQPLGDTSPQVLDGRHQHRRIVSRLDDPEVLIDIGYNQFKAGLSGNAPYAYTADEVCYVPRSGFELTSEGVSVLAGNGSVVWRPAGAVSQSAKVHQDVVSICAFSPARADAWSHRLPPDKVGVWPTGDAERPRVKHSHPDAIRAETLAGFNGGTIRRIFSAERDGADRLEISQLSFPAGVVGMFPPLQHDEIYYLETGTIAFKSDGEPMFLEQGQFAYRPVGAGLEEFGATADAIVIRWAGPIPPETRER